MKQILIASLLALSAAACGPNGISSVTQRPIEVKPKSDFNYAGVIGYQPVTIHTATTKGKPVRDAYCELTGRGFTANFLTPAIVQVPNFGKATGDLVIYCRFEAQSISRIVKVQKNRRINLTGLAAGVGTAVGGPLAGAAAGTITDLATPEPTSDFGYEDSVVIRFADE